MVRARAGIQSESSLKGSRLNLAVILLIILVGGGSFGNCFMSGFLTHSSTITINNDCNLQKRLLSYGIGIRKERNPGRHFCTDGSAVPLQAKQWERVHGH